MKRNIVTTEEVELAGAECWIHPRYWEDSEINGVADDAENPKMPLIAEHLGEKAWHIIINFDTGQICNWPQGTTASVHYKSCDENYIHILDDQLGVVKEYDGYVPDFLCPKEMNDGDYVVMDIDENGFIQGFNNNLDDIFDDEED